MAKKSSKKALPVEDQPERVDIPALHVKRVRVPIRGITPLVVNNWSEKAKQQMRDAQQGKARAKKPPKDPQECFEAAKYIDPKTGRDSVRAAFFKAAMVGAGRFVEGVNMTMLRMTVFVEGDYLPLEFASCSMDESMVRNANGVADIRYRPMYAEWRTDIVVQFYPTEVSLSEVLMLIREGGQRVGICEGRPEKSPSLGWGRFDIDLERCAGGAFTAEAAA